jgi:site-specific DNA-methyltransferase (adenine-specific)
MIHVGDCLEVMRGMACNSVDAVVTDPPYGIGFMGKAWDGKDIVRRHGKRRSMPSTDPTCTENGGHGSLAAAAGLYDLSPHGMLAFQRFSAAWAAEALRVLKPGGHLLAFASPRTYHRMAAGVEDAGFEIRDQIMWVFGSGFPKSHNGEWGGTALKPAHEPIVMARKPLSGTVARNWEAFGTGGLNIDACRVATSDNLGGGDQNERAKTATEGWDRPWMREPDAKAAHAARVNANVAHAEALGRWPANLVHDGSEETVAAFPRAPGQQGDLRGHSRDRASLGIYGDMGAARDASARRDHGSAARFFYCAKATREDRNDGLESRGRPAVAAGATMRDREKADWPARNGNHHPTVKPTELMRYLCRLVTPRGGLVLDPFAGSGSTGRAAVMEGFQFAGIELDPEYAAIAEARIRAVQPGLPLGDAA